MHRGGAAAVGCAGLGAAGLVRLVARATRDAGWAVARAAHAGWNASSGSGGAGSSSGSEQFVHDRSSERAYGGSRG